MEVLGWPGRHLGRRGQLRLEGQETMKWKALGQVCAVPPEQAAL